MLVNTLFLRVDEIWKELKAQKQKEEPLPCKGQSQMGAQRNNKNALLLASKKIQK